MEDKNFTSGGRGLVLLVGQVLKLWTEAVRKKLFLEVVLRAAAEIRGPADVPAFELVVVPGVNDPVGADLEVQNKRFTEIASE